VELTNTRSRWSGVRIVHESADIFLRVDMLVTRTPGWRRGSGRISGRLESAPMAREFRPSS
jgi:hypothetical protein